MISATAGLLITCLNTSPGRNVRLREKFSVSSAIASSVISTEKHCCRCVFENRPTAWLMTGIKSLLPVKKFLSQSLMNELHTNPMFYKNITQALYSVLVYQ